MCGIAGIFDISRSPEDKERLLGRMLMLIRHRGPDAMGMLAGNDVGLGSARLRIIDLSGGDQPIHNEDRSIWVVMNGEIFNFPELRADLEQNGHVFYTGTDTEVLVHLYEEKGPEMFGHLNGQFAIAIWDRPSRTLLVGRDRMGIHPLFYYSRDGKFLFASEMKCLFADPQVPREIDTDTLSDIFTCWAPVGAATIFRGIRQFPPGHYGIFRNGRLELRSYWHLDFERQRPEERPFSSCLEELDSLLADSIRMRLRADVPVGAYLSGGLDSSYITALVKKNFNNRLETFSVSFDDNRFDEGYFQQKTAENLETNHHTVRCTAEDIREKFPEVIWHTETPILRTAPCPMFRLSSLVKKTGFKVVLTGEGSDEIFGGYDIFKEDRIRRFWARRPDSQLRPLLLKKLYSDVYKWDGRGESFLKSFFRKGLDHVDSPVFSHLIRWNNTAQIRTFFSDEVQSACGGPDEFINRYIAGLPENFMRWDPLSRSQYTEISIFLSNYLLSSQGDRMAMGHSVEGRVPFLDHRVVEFACRLPSSYCLNVLKDKFILRKSAEKILPDYISARPKKPYRAPISECFVSGQESDYVQDLLSEPALRDSGLFNPGKVARLLNKCRANKGRLLSERENMALVGIISAQLLHRMFIMDSSSLISGGLHGVDPLLIRPEKGC